MEEQVYLSFYIGVIGNIISVLLFLSPIETFWRIVKHGSTEEYESLPYICTLLNSSLWTFYGIIKPGEYLVATVNGFGVAAEAVYVTLFLVYAPTSIKVETAKLVGILDVGVLVMAIMVTQLALEGEARISAVGFMGAGLNIIMYGSPLVAMRRVVRSKSVEYMPFFLSFFIFVNAGVWALYAFILHDYFLGVPNGTGFLLGLTQLVLYAIYRNSKASKNNTTTTTTAVVINGVDQEGWQHEHLLISSSNHQVLLQPACMKNLEDSSFN